MRLRAHTRRAGRIRAVAVRRAALALVALFAIAVGIPLTAASPADAAPSHWKWTSAIRVANYDPSGSGGITCPTSTLCVAANANRVLWSTHPTAAKSWASAELEPSTSPYLVGGDVALEAIDCASEHFCAAVDNMGQIFTTTEPTAGPTAWTATTLNSDTVAELTAVSCASPTACVALAYTGAAFTLTPSGWQRAQVTSHEGADFFAVSCASSTLCEAVEADGYIYSIDPSVGGAWKRTKVGHVPQDGWDSIDCPSATMCVAAGNYNATGVVAVSKSLAKGTWKSAKIKGASGGFDDVSCRSAKFCVLVGGSKDYWSTKPSSSSSSWHAFAPRTQYSQVEATCLTSKLCFVEDIGTKIGIGHRR